MLLMKYECTTYWLIAELAAWHTEQQMPQMDGRTRTRTAAAKKNEGRHSRFLGQKCDLAQQRTAAAVADGGVLKNSTLVGRSAR